MTGRQKGKETVPRKPDPLFDQLGPDVKSSLERNTFAGSFSPELKRAIRRFVFEVAIILVATLIIFAATKAYAHYISDDFGGSKFPANIEQMDKHAPPTSCRKPQYWRWNSESFKI
ncbi:hypothetical protein KQ247_13085 [Ruegeria pomeroyi]|uniref:Uncharacterized protein n=2 Tax=Ruegeria pomeroyi TaxID=89184 RepID=Q5LV20_RUEPO|nr:hypothetical protein [Ruegeria pomeroyi]AAV94187.1 hypothetical protein SPO0882 [Ruegeria pomeroyi DSS-3]NVK95739.1 hypothetical protein [Ruegeria pomeroyi]NVL01140.1 hypothetical protein [Ruegeria pomeroyi]QWV07762.1 hypothetical protein KQ247_13085 [Ruegeria pomeroyi]